MLLSEDKYFESEPEKIWQRYCGFLDLSIEDFMQIQKHLLLEEMEIIRDAPLTAKLIKHSRPTSVEEFRKMVPLTTYDDYAPYIGKCQEDLLTQKPMYWTHTSGKSGVFKWAPYTERADESFAKHALGAVIMGMTNTKGEVNLKPGVKVIANLPERPYISGSLAFSISNRFSWHTIPPLEIADKMNFQKRIEEGFKLALRDRVDLVISMSSVLMKISDSFAEGSRHSGFSTAMLHPRTLTRLCRGWVNTKREHRKRMPKDLWPVKGVISWGSDIGIYKDRIKEYWGREPYEFYAFTEVGIVAMQAWNKKWMTFSPYSAFLEFIPEEEWLKWRENPTYQPRTVLMDEVQENKIYEVVITNFYGMPFLRYRRGDLVKFVAMKDEETGVNLPQMVFQARADGIIDIAGFTRLDEKTIWQAIANTKIAHAGWTIAKEQGTDHASIRIYFEPTGEATSELVAEAIHNQLKELDHDYRDLEKMLGIRPLKVTLLPKGAFKKYTATKQAAGIDLAHLKPPHMNATEAVIDELVNAS